VERRVEAERVGDGEEGCELLGRPSSGDACGGAAVAGVGGEGDVRLDELSAHGEAQRRADDDVDVVDRLRG